MEIEVGANFVKEVVRLLKSSTEVPALPPTEVNEAISSMKVQGSVQFRGFSKGVLDTFPGTLKFYMQIANLGERARIIIDIEK